MIFFSRTYWAIRLLRLPRLNKFSHDPGMVLVQIDGLSLTQFNKALHKERMPFIANLLKKEKYKLYPFYSGLPSNTPAVQGELFFGVKSAVPSFSFVDHLSGHAVKMQDTSYVEAFESLLKHQGTGLLTNGSSYSNIYTGGAKEAHFCWAKLGWGGVLHAVNPFVFPFLVILYIDIFLRMAVLLVIELLIAVMEGIRGTLKGRSLAQELRFVWLRVLVCVFLRELIVAGVCMDIMRGLPIIHLNFLGYDEQSHCRGPSSAFAHWSMQGIDDAIRRINNVIKQSPYRAYDLWLYSDHGQEATLSYEQLNKQSIEQAIAAFFVGQATVTAMGPVGQIYLKKKVASTELTDIARKLVSELKIPLVLIRQKPDQVMAFTPRGSFILPDQAVAVFGKDHSFLEEIKKDILRICWHVNAGDLTIAGWSVGEKAISFPNESGAHAGMGIEETRGFALLPVDAPLQLKGKQYLRPIDLRRSVQRYLNKEIVNDVVKQEVSNKTLRVMTYNVHGCLGMDGIISIERISRVITRHHPDVIALQELDVGRARSNGIDQVKEIAATLGMKYYFHPVIANQDEHYGNAVLSRYPLTMISMKTLIKHRESKINEPRGTLRVSLEFHGKVIHLINTHLSIWPTEQRLQVIELLANEYQDSCNHQLPFILCGDFNATPGSFVYRTISKYLKDSQASLIGHRPCGTWFGRYPLTQIDHVFTNSLFDVKAITVPRTSLDKTASDHLPVIVDLSFKK